MPEYSKLFYIPDCPPIGLDPLTGEYIKVPETVLDGAITKAYAVAAFLEPGLVRSHLPAVDYGPKSYILPTWAYTAVGFKHNRYWAAAFWIEYNHRWDPRNYDDNELVPAIQEYRERYPCGRLIEHLINCAINNHCFAAKNLFFIRWEAPIPVSIGCNADCLGCLSMQANDSLCPSHERISHTPSKDEIVSLAVRHLNHTPEAIVSFGQGCEGEPLTNYRLIAESIREIRMRTTKGTINLNTNGSMPDRIQEIAESGLDSVRISLNSARPELYRAYYRPKGYGLDDVVRSISLARKMGLYTMINYLVFPGITDQEEEIEALRGVIKETGVNFVHFKNLCIDPQLYLSSLPAGDSPAVGIKKMASVLRKEFPDVELGYFNQPVR
jgi:pyruvate-formate lyase-activating enzyme